jgi:uncharacterized protein with FMN-binding domain
MNPPKTSLAARLLASAALVLVSGGYVLWQPSRDDQGKTALKLASRAKIPAAAAPAANVQVAEAAPAPASPPAKVVEPEPTPSVDPAPLARPPARQAPQPAAPEPPAQDAAAEPAPAEEPAKPKLILPVYSDGDYTGEPVDSDFGPVQVEVTIAGGKLTNIKFLEIPDHRRRSAEISEAAIPILVQEAIQAQGPRIDVISQATYTTITFANALYNALSKAEK